MPNEHDFEHRRYTALYVGTVVDVADPERLGRVRVTIPGLIDEGGSGWAYPLWPGAGASQRGMFAPPPVGADVGILFLMGDIDRPHYLGGYPGRTEAPPEAAASEPEDAPKVFAYETDRWRFLFDGRRGKQILQLRDKKTDDVIEIDGVALGVKIKATSAIRIECDGAIDIKGSAVTINGRFVAASGKVI